MPGQRLLSHAVWILFHAIHAKPELVIASNQSRISRVMSNLSNGDVSPWQEVQLPSAISLGFLLPFFLSNIPICNLSSHPTFLFVTALLSNVPICYLSPIRRFYLLPLFPSHISICYPSSHPTFLSVTSLPHRVPICFLSLMQRSHLLSLSHLKFLSLTSFPIQRSHQLPLSHTTTLSVTSFPENVPICFLSSHPTFISVTFLPN